MLKNSRFEVLTPSGWQGFDGIAASPKRVVRITTNVGATRTSDKHRVIVNGKEKLSVSLKPGDWLTSKIRVVKVELLADTDILYDLVNVAGGNVYIADGFVHHNCDFLGSAGTLISGDKLQKLAFVEPIWQNAAADFKIYENPGPGRKYIMTADPSEGVDKDYSVVSVFDVTEKPFKHVALYKNNKIPPEMFAEVIVKIGKKYNDALAIVETNSIGVNVAKDLWYEFEYENVLRSVERETGARVSFSGQSKLGVRTTKATKRIGCSTLKSLLETDTLITNDYDAISELSTFIAQGSSWGAEEGKYDDVVMSMVLLSWFTQQVDFEDYMAGTINAALRKARTDAEFGPPMILFSDGTEEFGEVFDNSMFLNQGGEPQKEDLLDIW